MVCDIIIIIYSVVWMCWCALCMFSCMCMYCVCLVVCVCVLCVLCVCVACVLQCVVVMCYCNVLLHVLLCFSCMLCLAYVACCVLHVLWCNIVLYIWKKKRKEKEDNKRIEEDKDKILASKNRYRIFKSFFKTLFLLFSSRKRSEGEQKHLF